jgi:hypothetical protein
MMFHPRTTSGRFADDQSGQVVRHLASRDFQKVLEKLILRIRSSEDIFRLIVHATDVAGMGAISPAPYFRRELQNPNRASLFSSGQCRA